MDKFEKIQKQKNRLNEMLIYERKIWAEGKPYIAGIDEVGRGPLAGPVVAAAVVLPYGFDILGVDDSKKLSEKRREALYDVILDNVISAAIGRVEPEIIDKINILEATKKAMLMALTGLSENPIAGEKIIPNHVLIDALTLKQVKIPQNGIVHGDSLSVSIAAASIIAKVTRDREMIKMAEIYPGYAFEKNKGYGTKAHYEGLAAFGPTPIHRKTFL